MSSYIPPPAGAIGYLSVPPATETPQVGLYMNGRDIIGVRNIQAGSNNPVLSPNEWDLDIGAGTSDAGSRGNITLNYDVGRGFVVRDGNGGAGKDLLAINKTFDGTNGTGEGEWDCDVSYLNGHNQFTFGGDHFFKDAGNTKTFFSLGSTFRVWDASLVQTTVGAAGAASALPATPKKYLKMVDTDGSAIVIPVYAGV